LASKLPEVSAFVPAYNEAGNIAHVVARLHDALEKYAELHEIIVVLHEGCTDGSYQLVRDLIARDPRLRLVLQPLDRGGYGTALRIGIGAARYRYLFYTDADDQFDPEEIGRLVELIRTCDLVTGYRIARQDPLPRRLTGWIYNLLVDATLRTDVRDVDCAFKLFRREVFDGVTLGCETGMIDPEIICKARRAGFRIAEVGVHHHRRRSGAAHFEAGLGLPSPGVVLDVLAELWRVRREVRGTAAL
jgi:glycosyltransferase involved in cell wall biosynthesis